MDGETTLVLGIGNILWADEGFGVRVVEQIAQRHAFPDPVRVMDGGTQGLFLLPFLEGLDTLIIVDAVDFGLPPATLHVVRDADVPVMLGARKMSLHQTGFQEVLALMQLRDQMPRHVVLVGVQPVMLEDYGGGLTPEVAEQIEPAVATVLDILDRDCGVRPLPTAAGQGDLLAAAVTRHAYESGRPDEAAACRVGDERLLARLER